MPLSHRNPMGQPGLAALRAVLAVFALWLFTGIYIVQVEEQAVVRRFGAVIAERVPPGLHFGLPWGIDRIDRVRMREQKRLNVGFEFPDQALGRPVAPAHREFLSGDENLIDIELLVQYTIREPRAYLFCAEEPTQMLRQAAEAAIVTTAAERPVDLLLTTGKLEAQSQLQTAIQRLADHDNLGVVISAVNIQSVTPPLRVSDAFRDVASAREDRDRLVKEAESYANAVLPAAAGEASRLHEDAAGYRDQKIREARGDAGRFIKAYSSYRLSPDVTATRLYLETVEEILPRLKIIHQDERAPSDLNLVPRPAAGGSPPQPNGGDNGQLPASPASGRP